MGSWFFNLPATAPDQALRFRKSVATPLLEIYLFPPADSFGCTDCAVSSVVEHYIDTVGVTGSNPVSRTTFSPHGDVPLRDDSAEAGRGARDFRDSAEHEGCSPEHAPRDGCTRASGHHRRIRVCQQRSIYILSPAASVFRGWRMRIRLRVPPLRGGRVYCSTLRSASASCAERSALRNCGSSGRHIWNVVCDSHRASPSLTEQPRT